MEAIALCDRTCTLCCSTLKIPVSRYRTLLTSRFIIPYNLQPETQNMWLYLKAFHLELMPNVCRLLLLVAVTVDTVTLSRPVSLQFATIFNFYDVTTAQLRSFPPLWGNGIRARVRTHISASWLTRQSIHFFVCLAYSMSPFVIIETMHIFLVYR